MKPPRPLPLVPYLPSTYRATLQAIATPIPATARPIQGRRQTIPDLFERRPYDPEKVRRRLLAQLPAKVTKDSASETIRVSDEGVDDTQLAARQDGLRKGVPFFRDEAHRQPTKGLYRALLRACSSTGIRASSTPASASSPSPVGESDTSTQTSFKGIRAKIRYDWRRYRHLTSIPQARNFLTTQYDLYTSRLSSPLSELAATDEKHRKSKRLFPLASLTSVNGQTEDRAEVLGRSTSSRRPRLTGGFMRPSHNNGPLPRLRPQPESLSMMINRRHKQQARLKNRVRELGWIKDDMRAEVGFWQSLVGDGEAGDQSSEAVKIEASMPRYAPVPVPVKGLKAEEVGEWSIGWNRQAFESIKDIDRQLQNGWKRKLSKFDDGLVMRVMRAKKRREAYLRDRAAAAEQTAQDGVD